MLELMALALLAHVALSVAANIAEGNWRSEPWVDSGCYADHHTH